MRADHLRIVVSLLLSVAAGTIAAATTPGNAPQLPITGTRIVNVTSEPQLQTAMGNLQNGDTILIADGTYNLTNTLYINGKSNVTIRGTSGSSGVVLAGQGMDNTSGVALGIWSNSPNTTIAHLTIRDTYDNTIIFNPGAQAPLVYSVTLINSGSQFVKSNPITNPDGSVTGNDNGILEYSVMQYTGNPPGDHGGNGGGYTNGISAHAAQNWTIRGNLFKNFHVPDGETYLWNPAVLMWNHSANTIVEQNTFINVDRAVAFGLGAPANGVGFDHSGGVIRNNFVVQTPGLFTPGRAAGSDGLIIVDYSPNSLVYQNSVLSNGNTAYAIEFRFAQTTAGEARNNLSDVPIHLRDSATATLSGNLVTATPSLFVNPASSDLHLLATATAAIDKAPTLSAVTNDFDGDARPYGPGYDIGADEYVPASAVLTITTGSPLPNGVLGNVYTQVFNASGGTGPYSWSATGTLPAGLSISSGGLLSGTPTATGTFTFTVKVTDAASATASSSFSLTITSSSGGGQPPTVTSPPSVNPTTVTVGVPETFTAAATDPSGGSVTYTWNFGDGTSATGQTVTHTYTAAGPFTVTLTMTTTSGGSATSTLNITVVPAGGGGGSPVPMTVSKAQGSVKFSSGGHDSCSFAGVLPGIAAGFDPTGKSIVANFAGATNTFTLDKHGKGKSSNGTIALKIKLGKRDKVTHKATFPGGNVPFAVKLTNGTWAATWNLSPANNASKQPLPMVANIILDGVDYQATVTVSYTAKAKVGGKFKK